MNFKSISKNNIGILIVLLLTVVLSQSRFFNFMVNNALGRTLLIAILLLLSYIHKILGVVCVFLIIIMFNNSDVAYLEGFTPTTTTTTTDAEKEKIKNNLSTQMTSKPSTTTASTPASSTPASTSSSVASTASSAPTKAVSTPTTTVTPSQSAALQAVGKSISNMKGQEGFDIIGKERNIQKGRNSNSIPVNDFMRESTNVAPYEGSLFSESFSNY